MHLEQRPGERLDEADERIGGELVLNPEWEARLPEDVKKLVAETAAAIQGGQKKVELDMDEPKSD